MVSIISHSDSKFTLTNKYCLIDLVIYLALEPKNNFWSFCCQAHKIAQAHLYHIKSNYASFMLCGNVRKSKKVMTYKGAASVICLFGGALYWFIPKTGQVGN